MVSRSRETLSSDAALQLDALPGRLVERLAGLLESVPVHHFDFGGTDDPLTRQFYARASKPDNPYAVLSVMWGVSENDGRHVLVFADRQALVRGLKSGEMANRDRQLLLQAFGKSVVDKECESRHKDASPAATLFLGPLNHEEVLSRGVELGHIKSDSQN